MGQVFDIIDNLHNTGDLAKLYKTGIVNPTVYRYYQIEKEIELVASLKRSKFRTRDFNLVTLALHFLPLTELALRSVPKGFVNCGAQMESRAAVAMTRDQQPHC